jgi:hypothetical protein
MSIMRGKLSTMRLASEVLLHLRDISWEGVLGVAAGVTTGKVAFAACGADAASKYTGF